MNRLYFEGLDLREWDRFADDVFTEAEGIVRDYVLGAEQDIRAAYPSEAASLQTGMTHDIAPNKDAMLITASVINKHPLAWMYDNGTAQRFTKQGWRRGFERPHHVFVPRAYDWARRMYDELRTLLEQTFGFTVSGQVDEDGFIGG